MCLLLLKDYQNESVTFNISSFRLMYASRRELGKEDEQ